MLSSSLKERMAQLKSLQDEEKKVIASSEKTPDPVGEAPPPNEPEVSEEKTAEPEVVVENAPEPVEEDPEAEDESEVEVSQGLSQQDQDVFKALDEADGVDDGPQDRAPVPVKPKKKAKKAKDKPKSGSICKRIFCFFLWLVCTGGAAVILSFYFLDYPEGFWRSSGPAPAVTKSPTMSPTIALSHAPTTLQWAQFLESFLIPISGEEVFMDKKSPQYRAGKYILDDPYTAEVPTTGRLNDRYASITFYFATGGENWNSCYYGDESCDSGQWLEGDVCDWNAVSCDDEGRIVSYLFANADGNGMVGTLPPEMRLMSFMTDLVIVNNAIAGTIPTAFSESAGSLRSLLLPDNELSGEIPNDFFANSPLEYVHLANNKFSGMIPTTLGEITTLQQLDISGNTMSGTIPTEIGGYVALEAISLANNFFEGEIPDEIYDLTELKYLHMNGNDLSGTLSKSIRNLSLLQGLRIGGSGLAGQLPDELFRLTKLVEVDISDSSFDGRLSLGFLNLEGLEKLNVANNNFSGTVPFDFGQLIELTDLNLEGNEFTGAIPDSVCLLVEEENLEVLTADCEEVVCECCTKCF